MSDDFDLMSLPEAAAEATPSEYNGIITEQLLARYPDEDVRYVRGSSGFAGFSHVGFTRAGITRFHEEMEKLVGTTRWRGWAWRRLFRGTAGVRGNIPQTSTASRSPDGLLTIGRYVVGAW
jgi:hypothetical protein